MNWVESIRISFGSGSRGLEDLGGMDMLEEQLTPVPGLCWECYRNMAVPEDVFLVLKWEGEPPVDMESPVAAHLVRELNRYGLAGHTAWVSTELHSLPYRDFKSKIVYRWAGGRDQPE